MTIYNLGDIPTTHYDKVGGKAKGLDILFKNNIRIAKGFVIEDANKLTESDFNEIYEQFEKLNLTVVSVRSSANNEDKSEYSNAGQFETFLDVDKNGLKEAILKCVDSINSERVKSYSSNFLNNDEIIMNIVIEEMINPIAAGVLFTVDPIEENKMLIEVVEGIGENLVSGKNASYQIKIDSQKFDENVNIPSFITADMIHELYDVAKKMKEELKYELDLEFAYSIDKTLYMLQLRPITTNDEVSIHEFDSKNNLDNHLLTTRNIGEMYPGASTPLSLSTSVYAIDYGMRNMLYKIGVIKKIDSLNAYSCSLPICNHLFIDLSQFYEMSNNIFMTDPVSMNLSILGEEYPSYPKPAGKNRNFIVKAINMCKFGKYLFSSKKANKRTQEILKDLEFTEKEDPIKIYEELDKKLWTMNEALSNHYISSTYSGAMSSGLYMTLKECVKSRDEYSILLSKILSNIDGIESVDILKSLTEIAILINNENNEAVKLSNQELLEYIKNSEKINALFNEFLSKHGHRCLKESELRSIAWKNNQIDLMNDIKAIIKSFDNPTIKEEETIDLNELFKGFKKKKTLITLSKMAREAVVARECSKSNFIKVFDKFKDQYRILANKLVEENYLSDMDLIYFLTHKEIKELLDGNNALKKKAFARRKLFEEQEMLKFDDIVLGRPEPIKNDNIVYSKNLTGVPVCKGVVYGKAKIVKSIDDANKLTTDSIMVSNFTDIGWSSYYSTIKALVTEVGSALSHGAVVAREYGLTTIVNVKNATQIIKDGDYLCVNGNTATVSIIEKEEYEKAKEVKNYD